MKKLFTFLMAMVITTMVFGQFVKSSFYPLPQPIPASQDRTGWVGGDEDFPYGAEMVAGEKIAMRLPAAGALPAGKNLSITKVSFGWSSILYDQDAQGNTIEISCDPNFRILIYSGGNGDWIDQQLCVAGSCHTQDTAVQGNLLYSQTYECTTPGWQMVELNEPVAISSNQEVWVAIQALGTSCTWITYDMTSEHPEWFGQYLDFFNTTSLGHIWIVPAFSATGEAPCFAAKYAVKALIDNGEAYVKTTDWLAQMYSLDTYETQEAITYLYIDDFMMDDSLYLAPALWNMGPDSNVADGRVQLYVENSEIIFLDTILSVLMQDVSVASMSGVIFKNMGGLLAFRDMEDLGLTFPFNVCISYESFGYDPVASNNTACAEITDVEPDGISENTNTLTISPNPASTYIKVENTAGSQIAVYNIAGQQVLSIASAEANETLNVSNLTAGLYVVRVVNGNEVSTAKVSIVR